MTRAALGVSLFPSDFFLSLSVCLSFCFLPLPLCVSVFFVKQRLNTPRATLRCSAPNDTLQSKSWKIETKISCLVFNFLGETNTKKCFHKNSAAKSLTIHAKLRVTFLHLTKDTFTFFSQKWKRSDHIQRGIFRH